MRLLEKFRQAIEQSGSEPPEDEEALLQQLELVLIRHPGLLRVAYRRFRHAQVADVAVPLPAELHSDVPLEKAQRGLYGVFPRVSIKMKLWWRSNLMQARWCIGGTAILYAVPNRWCCIVGTMGKGFILILLWP